MIRKDFVTKSLIKGDKGTWIVDSEMVVELKDKKWNLEVWCSI